MDDSESMTIACPECNQTQDVADDSGIGICLDCDMSWEIDNSDNTN